MTKQLFRSSESIGMRIRDLGVTVRVRTYLSPVVVLLLGRKQHVALINSHACILRGVYRDVFTTLTFDKYDLSTQRQVAS